MPAGRGVPGQRWVRLHVTEPLLTIIRRGADAKTLAFSGAMGITLGIFPIYGVTAVLCACAVGLLGPRCNAPTMLLANLIATPLELSLVIPFLRLGEWVVGGKRLLLSKNALWEALTGKASWEVLLGLWHALVGWSVAAPFVIAALYFALLPVVKFSIQRYGIVVVPSSSLTPLMKDSIDVVSDEDESVTWIERSATRLE
ncbi:hypothetical protein MPTK1_3g03740 [Marchantia polymorpha subsp. ruderalis]|uniref:DUF2062 domain-containing protein n=2 Tax=Marchantia polymorpha TaxID=3197 RepID=A0AAF6AX52_MARPO|nr:hypothetical protein MARPO_0022s0158 [Marchantia polymorpha]BBN04333.1 hypothetical protein Mp_3g03740 [Marchantia polymorpha subsp. ruderalis]PTQ44070.1 hypothetical protein MARPO_0022s0158 [Marchantia polymorpha]PTQ44071.1 hypothetical protein MARPO_0022s0158 [Marchantia polymorpha]PTQ44072.1 hypothetical protein MARPO_0022s0158 [Marchantia polymorpha]|eukprot:PTQ44069.1 hypothetical protein MARPO_0022s0158 [Marchantia polymorpha]